MQSRAMREYAARRGWTIALQVREVGSGAAKREAREKLLEAARRREIDVVLVWRLDRWGRSVTDLLRGPLGTFSPTSVPGQKRCRILPFERPVWRPLQSVTQPWPHSILFGQIAPIIRQREAVARDNSRASITPGRQPGPDGAAVARSGNGTSSHCKVGRCESGS
jgi:resolvase-like protein